MAQRDQPTVYRIRVDGHIDERRTDLLGNLTIIHEPDGTTTLIGPVADQAALYGIILSLRDMGLKLLDVEQIDIATGSEADSQTEDE